MSIEFPPTVETLRSEWAELADWEERYEYLIELGRQLPPLEESQRVSGNLVHGCMSTVWLVARRSDEPDTDRLEIQAESDSLIVKGLIVVLLALFNHRRSAEILATDPGVVFKELGLDQHLSPQRRNGLHAMVQRIKQLAATATR